MGTMRVARAEFIKIFKKPSLYLMGIILAIIIVMSSFFFKPEGKVNSSVKLSGNTVNQVVASFEKETGTENKINYDLKLEQAENMVNFYTYLATRASAINSAYSALKSATTALMTSKSEADFNAFKERFTSFETAVNSQPTLDQYKEIFQSYSNGPLHAQHATIFEQIRGMFNQPATTFCNQFNSNTISGTNYLCKDALQKINEDSQNLYFSHLHSLVIEMTSLFKSYATAAELNYSKLPASLENGYLIPGTQTTVHSQKEYFNYFSERVRDAADKIKTFIGKMVSTDQPLILISQKKYTEIISKMDNIIGVLEATNRTDLVNKASQLGMSKTETDKITEQPLSMNQAKVSIIKRLVNFDNEKAYMLDLNSELFSNAILVKIDDKVLDELTKIIDKSKEKREEVYGKLKELDGTTGSVSTANRYISEYKHINLIANNIVADKLLLSATEGLSNKEVASLQGYDFSTFSRYSTKEDLLKNEYLYKTNSYAFEYSDTFSFNQSSANKTTVFDFMFYALRISALFIIVFTIIMASSIIASEFDSGTIKLLAIRPFNRGKIIMGKFFATMFFVICFVLFSAVISLISGLAMFNWNMQPVLAVFNSSVAFSISPVLLMLINIICVILEIMFFAIVAICMSTITRSFAATLSSTIVVYLISLGLNMLFSNKLWYAYSPFMNIDFFRFMGGAFSGGSSSVFSVLFTTPLLKNMNFFIALGMYGGIVAALILLTYLVFKKKDI